MFAAMKLSKVVATCNHNSLPVLRSNYYTSTARPHPIQPTNLSLITTSNNEHYNNTLGGHLALRLVQIGVTDVFSVPGDFNLGLLDHLVAEPRLNLIGCCNELNAGYAADGYARSRGVGACVVTFTVGGLSIMNAIAGAYSEDLPVICIVGGPNSNDYGPNNRILHHTIGLSDFSQELKCFQQITCHQVVVNNLDNAQEQIDEAIAAALAESKPVYISISCNLPGISHPSFLRNSLPLSTSLKYISFRSILSNPTELELAVETAVQFLDKAAKPVLLAGPKLRPAKAMEAFLELSDATGYPVAVMPSAKGFVPENYPTFMGTYWGTISTPYCAETVELADACLIAGPVFNDFTTVGHSLLIREERVINVQPQSVKIGRGPTFRFVEMKDFLRALAKRVKRNTTTHKNYQRMHTKDHGVPLVMRSSSSSGEKEPLRVNVVFQHLQKMLGSKTTVIAEAAIPWFSCQKLKLPEGCGYEHQLQYGSLGWSVGATLGYAQASPNKRVIACIGDGAFQMAAQEVSTMLRCRQTSIIFLINNGGYTIEEVIHTGPYNVIKNWHYTALVDAINNGQHKCWTTKVSCEAELVEAIKTATEEKIEYLCFIELIVHKDDTSKELIEFCTRASLFTNRSPKS